VEAQLASMYQRLRRALFWEGYVMLKILVSAIHLGRYMQQLGDMYYRYELVQSTTITIAQNINGEQLTLKPMIASMFFCMPSSSGFVPSFTSSGGGSFKA
jgi:hypothetical protein